MNSKIGPRVMFLAMSRPKPMADLTDLVECRGDLFQWHGIDFVLHRPLKWSGGQARTGWAFSEPVSGFGVPLPYAYGLPKHGALRIALLNLEDAGIIRVLNAVSEKIEVRRALWP